MHDPKAKRGASPPGLDIDLDDDVEILEVVGLEEDAPGAREMPADDDEEFVLSLDDEPWAEPGGSAAVATSDPAAGSSAATSGVGEAIPEPPAMSESERLIRLRADFENFKRRTEIERRRHEREAAAGLILRMLPVLDNFERALEAGTGADVTLRDGVVLIFRQILDELRKEGLHAIEAVGEHFDPALHDAVETDSASGLPPHTVIEEFQRGYRLAGRLLRPALVKVAVDATEHDSRVETAEGR